MRLLSYAARRLRGSTKHDRFLRMRETEAHKSRPWRGTIAIATADLPGFCPAV
jgi:hypothetical protein